MPRIVYARRSIENITYVLDFLWQKSPEAMLRARDAIYEGLRLLESYPRIGMPVAGHPFHHYLVIPFGESGYVAWYHYDPRTELLVVLALRHQKEAGFND